MSTTNGAISKTTFECFVCKKQGFNERVYLADKTPDGKTIYLEPDGVTAHRHKFKDRGGNNLYSQLQTPTTLATSADTIISLLKSIDQKLDTLLKEDRDYNLLDNR
jgi:hypothetical protein